jgi:predicted transcriptional regulator
MNEQDYYDELLMNPYLTPTEEKKLDRYIKREMEGIPCYEPIVAKRAPRDMYNQRPTAGGYVDTYYNNNTTGGHDTASYLQIKQLEDSLLKAKNELNKLEESLNKTKEKNKKLKKELADTKEENSELKSENAKLKMHMDIYVMDEDFIDVDVKE